MTPIVCYISTHEFLYKLKTLSYRNKECKAQRVITSTTSILTYLSQFRTLNYKNKKSTIQTYNTPTTSFQPHHFQPQTEKTHILHSINIPYSQTKEHTPTKNLKTNCATNTPILYITHTIQKHTTHNYPTQQTKTYKTTNPQKQQINKSPKTKAVINNKTIPLSKTNQRHKTLNKITYKTKPHPTLLKKNQTHHHTTSKNDWPSKTIPNIYKTYSLL